MEKRKLVTLILVVLILVVFSFTLILNNWLGLTGLAVFTDIGGGQTTLTLQEADVDNLGDVYVDTDTNHGGLLILRTGNIYRTYIKFNISVIPENQNIDNASLCLYVTTKKIQLINIHHVYSDFDESTITWTNQPCGVGFDNSENCNLTAESSVQINSDSEFTWFCWDVNNMIAKEYDLGNNNISMVLYTLDSDKNDFYSKEYTTDTSLRPYLNITYHTANTAPTISLILPQEGDSYGYNESISLNYSATDTEDNKDSCWFKIVNSTNALEKDNTTITECQNITFNVSVDDIYTLTIYVNDSLGEEVSDSASFSVAVGAPTIRLSSPVDVYLNYNKNIEFVYTATDNDLDSCELWGNFTGTFELNQTNTSVQSGVQDSIKLNLSDGTYLWNIKCNDSQENSAWNGNQTFYIDTTNPKLSLSEPSGEENSQTGIGLTFSVSDDNLDSCWYNLSKWDGEEWILYREDTIIDCSSTTFNVADDYSYQIYLTANDSAGNENLTSSSFSVDTSETPAQPTTPSGGGGGGGGGGGPSIRAINLEINKIQAIVYPNEEKSLNLIVKNNRGKSVNKCKIIPGKGYENWIESSDIKNIAPGEIVEFDFILTVPETTKEKNISIILGCLEGNQTTELEISFIKPSLDIKISEISLKSDELLINYLVEADTSLTTNLIFSVYSEKDKIAEQTQEITVNTGEKTEKQILLNIDNPKSGLLKIAITRAGEAKPLLEDSIIYDSKTITGFAALDILTNKTSYIILIIAIFAVLAILIVRRIVKHKRKT